MTLDLTPGGGRVCWSRGGSGPVQWVCPGLTPLPLCPDQLALDIDRDTEDQNRYLDGMVRSATCMHVSVSPALCPVPAGQPWGPRRLCPRDRAVFLPQGSDFMSMTGLLTGSVKRFSTMTRSGRDNRKLLCGVAGGLIVVFFILYYLLSRART